MRQYSMQRMFGSTVIALAALAVTAPALAKDPATARADRRKMCDEALATLYKSKPEVKAEIAKAAGYGCFSSFGISWFLGGAGGAGLRGRGLPGNPPGDQFVLLKIVLPPDSPRAQLLFEQMKREVPLDPRADLGQ